MAQRIDTEAGSSYTQTEMDQREIIRRLAGIQAASTGNWFALMTEAEEARRNWYLRLTAGEWREQVKRIIREWNGELRNCLNYIDRMETERAAAQAATVVEAPSEKPTPTQITFRAWRDMVLEPWKYGDNDWAEWLQWTEELESGPGRWRVAAFWLAMQDKEDAVVREAAAVTIQAAVRGHQVRTAIRFHDCCMCLAHRICPLQTDVGMMCRACAAQGPYDEETGPLPDPWSEFRADYVDMNLDEEDYLPKCRGCPAPLYPGDDNGNGFCCGDCEYDYIREAWRGR